MKENLKNIRTTLGYSQQEMADKLNIPIRTYRSYEYDSKGYPSSFIENLIYIFNVNINFLYTGRGEMFVSECFNTRHKQNNDKIAENITTFYRRFNMLQKENDLNDYQFSKEIGISENRIEKLGIGKTSPTIDELVAIKAHFDVSIDWLLFGDTPCQQSQDNNTTLSLEEINVLKKMAQKLLK